MFSICITHRVNEDISWVENLYADLVIYNKGDEWDLPYKHRAAPKIKSEVDTYIRGIIDVYDTLPNYRWVFLLRPDCEKHFPDITRHLSASQYINLSDDELCILSQSSFNYNFKEHLEIIKNTPNSEIEMQVYEMLVNILKNLRVSINDNTFLCGENSQFVVPVGLILSKPKEWWILLHSYILRLDDMFGENLSHIFKILWSPIFVNGSM